MAKKNSNGDKLMTFNEAKEYAHQQGGRLPTIEEVMSDLKEPLDKREKYDGKARAKFKDELIKGPR